MEYLKVILYGVIEGITEWLPISSTGHLILAEKLLALPYPEEFLSMFRVVIQLGAILAVVVLYFPRLWPFTTDPRHKYQRPAVWQLWFKIFAATLPALVLGLLLDDWLDAHLYNYITVAAMLILYGVFFILIENRRRRPTVRRLDQLTYKHALIIGCWQVLAMIPGTSRSGATIVGEVPGGGRPLFRRGSDGPGPGLRGGLCGERGGHSFSGDLCAKAQFQGVRLVPHRPGGGGAGGGLVGVLRSRCEGV